MSYASWNPYTNYPVSANVSYVSSSYRSLLTPNLGRVPSSSPTYWLLIPPPSGGIQSVTAGNAGISTSGTVDVTVSNIGVNGISALVNGGIAVGGTAQNPILSGTYYGGNGVTIAADLSNNLVVSGNYTEGNGINLTTNLDKTITIATDLSGGTGIAVSTAATPVISNTGVLSNVAGTGISVSGATGDVTIGNTGVTALTAGTGTSVSGSTGSVTIGNTGVLDLSGGTGLGVSAATGSVVLSNTGVTALTAGTGTSVSGSTGSVTIGNTGVLDLSGGTGLGVSATTGSVVLSNTGVTSIVAGTNVSISGATGAVTINSSGTSGTVTSVLSGGIGSGITVTGTAADPIVSANLTAGTGISLTPSVSTNTITVAQNISTSNVVNGVLVPVFDNQGTSGGILIAGYMHFVSSGTGYTRFTLPAGVWLCQMQCEVDCNGSTSSNALCSFQFVESVAVIPYNNLTMGPILTGGLATIYQTQTFVFSSTASKTYRVLFNLYGGAWYSNGSARCSLSFYQLGAAIIAGPDGTPFVT